MRYRLRRLFRTQCWHYIERGPMIWSVRTPDIIESNGGIVEGTTFAVYGSVVCHRRRWHRGEHVA